MPLAGCRVLLRPDGLVVVTAGPWRQHGEFIDLRPSSWLPASVLAGTVGRHATLLAGSLCSGCGGLDLAVMAVTGVRLAWTAETARAAAFACFYLVLCLLRPGGMGLADAKIAASIGLVLGWTSW